MSLTKVTLLFALVLSLSLVASASSSVDFSNSGGILGGSNAGLSLSGSTLTAANGLSGSGLITGTLGSVSFSTGVLTSGSLQMGGAFAAGGSFTITGNGTNGIPNGVLFSGTFAQPVTWQLVTLANGTHNYILTGVISGTLYGGMKTNGVTVQLTVNTGKGFFNGRTPLASGDTNVVVPEPGSLTLLGTGLIGIVGAFRRRFNLA
ncbi:MAG TPA: PEP-CTERM sorting domain-containing protein [Terriglobales bacterium]|nr:PEP-CTERM sorting domain-containing protein [Terriglobales bacterium]